MTVPTEADMEPRTPLENAQWNESVYRERAEIRGLHLVILYTAAISGGIVYMAMRFL